MIKIKINNNYKLNRNKCLIIIGIIVFLTPFVGVQISKFCNNFSLFPLFDFGLSLKDYFTIWISLWGVVGVVLTLYLNHKRLSSYERTEQNNRFAKAIELLGNQNTSTRIGGAIYLCSLANEYPEIYKQKTFDILCSHIRFTTSNADYKDVHNKKPSNEVQIIIDLLFKKKNGNDYFFREFNPDFSDCFLNGINLEDARIVGANFENTSLDEANLSDCNLKVSKFKTTTFINSELCRTCFDYSTFYKCRFVGIKDMPYFNFSDFKIVDFVGFDIGDIGIDFRGVSFNKVLFSSVFISEGNFTASCFKECRITKLTEFENSYILGVDYSSSKNIEQILIDPIDYSYDFKMEDVSEFETYLNRAVVLNVNRYNRVIKNKKAQNTKKS